MPTTISGANGVDNIGTTTVQPTNLTLGGPSWASNGNTTIGISGASLHTINGTVSSLVANSTRVPNSTTIASDVTMTPAAYPSGSLIICKRISGNPVITLPTSTETGSGYMLRFINTGNSFCTINRASTDLIVPGGINGTTLASIVLESGDSLVLVSIGTSQWLAVDGTARAKYSVSAQLQEYYENTGFTYAANQTGTFAHGMSGVPKLTHISMKNIIAEHGYTVGQEVPIQANGMDAAASWGVTLVTTSTNIAYRIGGSGIFINRYSDSVTQGLTPANWQVVIRAWT